MTEKDRLWKTIENAESFIKGIQEKRGEATKNKSTDLRYEIAFFLVKKIVSLFGRDQFENGDLVRNISSLRYAFEALVLSRLLIKEPLFVYSVYLGIHKIQEDQIENHISRLKEEIKFFEELEKMDSDDAVELGMFTAEMHDKGQHAEVGKSGSKLFENMAKIDSIKDERITLWSENVEHIGYGFHAQILREKVLPEYLERQKHLKDLNKKRAKSMIKNGLFNLFADSKGQESRVFKAAQDTRSWAQKAEDADLKEEYNFVYTYTSSIMHCTSYSFMTPDTLSKDEAGMIYKLSEQYIRHTLNNLEKYTTEMQVYFLSKDSDKWKHRGNKVGGK